MSEPFPQSGSSVSRARPGEAVTPRSPRGPETVINPERRPTTAPDSVEAASVGSSAAKSSIVRLLFPAEDEQALQTFDAQAGVQLGHFAVIERIRTGGMGAVFRALDTRLSRVVALKVLPPAMSRDPLIVQRFKNEAQAAAQLDHENVARVYYIGEDHGLHYIAFEFINGENLRDLIARNARVPVAEAVNYILQIASALVHTSAQGVVHRDIKPSNIIITGSGRAKLVDLGLARKENRDDQAADLTVAGTTLGTFDYISPEQARDPRAADVRSDIYSLGCTFYHMLTGEPPYPEGTVLQKLLQHQGDEAPDPSLKNRLVPENLSIVVRKMMAKDPRRRYQAPELLVRDLMLVAGAMGLRSASPEGLVWLAAQPDRASLLERHLAWMVTAALLLVIVGYMEFGNWFYAPAPEAWPPPGASAQSEGGNAKREKNVTRRNPDSRRLEGRQSNAKEVRSRAADESSAANGARDKMREPAEDDDPQLSEEKQPSDDPASDVDADADRDEDGAVVPIPLAGTGRGSNGEASAGPARESTAPETTSIGSKTAAAPGAGSTGPSGAQDEERRAAAADPGHDADTAVAAQDEGYFVLGRDGAPDRRFSTLEAACTSLVRVDGAVIELRFNGRRRESGVRITRKVTIRAARGYHPIVEFRPTETAPDSYQVRAVWIPSGALELVGVEVILAVDETVSADQWSLFSLERADSLRLQGVTLTVVNPHQRPATVVELRPGAGSMPDMPVAGVQPKPPLEVELADSFVRGEADLFVVRNTEPLRLAIKQSVVSLQGALLAARGHSDAGHENAQMEMRLEHVTAILGGGLVRVDIGNIPRKVLPLHVSSSNSIFSNGSSVPLVAMTGNAPPQDFRALLFWVGQNNFYDRFQTLWSIASTEGSGRGESWDAAAWRKNWTEAAESNPRFDSVIWNRRQWMQKPYFELAPADFSLDRQATNNQAIDGATNSTDAGANLTMLPRPASSLNDAAGERERE
jgi:serine/threonine-protein kinase